MRKLSLTKAIDPVQTQPGREHGSPDSSGLFLLSNSMFYTPFFPSVLGTRASCVGRFSTTELHFQPNVLHAYCLLLSIHLHLQWLHIQNKTNEFVYIKFKVNNQHSWGVEETPDCKEVASKGLGGRSGAQGVASLFTVRKVTNMEGANYPVPNVIP
jgi:hypothetical protein